MSLLTANIYFFFFVHECDNWQSLTYDGPFPESDANCSFVIDQKEELEEKYMIIVPFDTSLPPPPPAHRPQCIIIFRQVFSQKRVIQIIEKKIQNNVNSSTFDFSK